MSKHRHLALKLAGGLLAIWLLASYLLIPAVWRITFDRSVGFSHTTGRITHHIAPEVDQERDGLIADLQRVNGISSIDWQDGFQDPPEGRNGEGDPWKTDGRLPVIILTPQSLTQANATH